MEIVKGSKEDRTFLEGEPGKEAPCILCSRPERATPDSIQKKSWAVRCAESVRRQRLETEKKYGIRIGQTEIYCAKCGKPWGYGGHVCMDLRFEKLREEKERKTTEGNKAKNDAHAVVKDLGPTKISIYLMIPVTRVTKWIQRGSVPPRYVDKILVLQKCGER